MHFPQILQINRKFPVTGTSAGYFAVFAHPVGLGK